MIVRFEIVGVVGEVERLHNMRKSRWDPYSWEAVENLHACRLIPIPAYAIDQNYFCGLAHYAHY